MDTPLGLMARTTPTQYWNDSCSIAELEYAVANGAVGATSNPTIVGEVLKKEADTWLPRIRAIQAERPAASDLDITWQVIEEMAVRGAAILAPICEQSAGRTGRLSIQTNPTEFRSSERMLEQGRRFAGLAPNIQVKFPATSAGLQAIAEATELGISINATVSFTLPQALAVGAAVERALERREAAGLDVAAMSPVCTLMVGRLDDWVKAVCERDEITVDPAAPNWAGIAVFKRAAALFGERGYRTRLLAAAYRHHLHWSELIGGDVSLTIPYAWQRRFNASSIAVRPRFDDPVPAAYLDELRAAVPDFERAYQPDGLTIEEFDAYGATVRTLRGFIGSYWDLVRTIDDVLLPNPDVRR
ncbi:MAG TPA: transaldolase family protein [Candidatus Limnocylindrales bacterium]|nr:transaldolase family protein [Candidatus Limnocylindrales bacterium]